MFRPSGVYLGWVGFENLGDEAMWRVCQQRFASVRWSVLDDLQYPVGAGAVGHAMRDMRWVLRVAREELRDARRLKLLALKWRHRTSSALAGQLGLLGGGTLINRTPGVLDAYVSLRKQLRHPIPVFGTGVANREYWQNSEGWVDQSKQWAEALCELPVVGVRGPQSKRELEAAGLANVVVCGDPAVMLHEPLKQRSADKDKLTIGINFGEAAGGMIGSESDIEAKLCQVAQVAGQKHRIKFLPVWPKDVDACSRLARRAQVPDFRVADACTTHESFREAVRDMDFLIAFKLHAGILAAAYNVPFLMVEYQPKCRDFAASLGWERFCVRAEEFDTEFALSLIAEVAECGDNWRGEICQRMCGLARTFDDYCAKLERIWS